MKSTARVLCRLLSPISLFLLFRALNKIPLKCLDEDSPKNNLHCLKLIASPPPSYLSRRRLSQSDRGRRKKCKDGCAFFVALPTFCLCRRRRRRPIVPPPPPFLSNVFYFSLSALSLSRAGSPLDNSACLAARISIPFNWIIAERVRFRKTARLFSS